MDRVRNVGDDFVPQKITVIMCTLVGQRIGRVNREEKEDQLK